MFTGIISNTGKIKKIIHKNNSLKITIICEKNFIQDIKLGDSISINGICLTVINYGINFFEIEVILKTFQTTNLKFLKINDLVNLEKSLSLNDKLHGHLVYGHVDTIVRLKQKHKIKNTFIYIFNIPFNFHKKIIYNASVSLDGISLTIAKVISSIFHVHIAHYTYLNTHLKTKKIGSVFNLEIDMIQRINQNFNQKGNNKNE